MFEAESLPPVVLEAYRRTSGIVVITKAHESACPLGDLVAQSGIESRLPHLSLKIDTSGEDFRYIVQGGQSQGIRYKDMLLGDDYKPFDNTVRNGLWTAGLYTQTHDSYGRPVSLGVILRGPTISDPQLSWQIFKGLFPSLRFVARDPNPDNAEDRKEVKALVAQHIVPHLNFSL